MIALRNPSAQAQVLRLDLATALELPEGAARTWQATPAFADGASRALAAGTATAIELKPYEVVVWDLVPAH